ncbi:MAG TPA: RND transporter [Cytophagales bacterium]|nr:RND transporter [Cytophagales bacterium]
MRIAFLILALGILSCQSKKEVVFPEYKSITQSVYASGIVKSRNQYQVFSNSPGVIAKLFVTDGDFIQQGQPIALISNKAIQLSRENSQLAANFNAAQNNQDRLDELMYSVEVAKEKNKLDSTMYARQLNLWGHNVGTKVDLDQKALTAKNSKALLESALLRLQQLKKQIDFAARQSKKMLEISSAQTNDLIVKSEVTGKVFSILKKQGEMVTSLTPIAMVGESTHFYLELQVDEYDITQIREGQKIIFTMDSYQRKVFDAVVSKIYPMMNERSRTFTIEADFVNAPEKLYPFLTAEANIIITTKEKALLIPRQFLIDETFVLLKNGEKRKVQTGIMDYQKAEIVSGITDKDAIVQPL